MLDTLARVLLIAAVTTVFGSVVDEEMQVNIMHSVSIETRDTARVALPLIVSLVLLEYTVYFISNFSVTKSNTCSSF